VCIVPKKDSPNRKEVALGEKETRRRKYRKSEFAKSSVGEYPDFIRKREERVMRQHRKNRGKKKRPQEVVQDVKVAVLTNGEGERLELDNTDESARTGTSIKKFQAR